MTSLISDISEIAGKRAWPGGRRKIDARTASWSARRPPRELRTRKREREVARRAAISATSQTRRRN